MNSGQLGLGSSRPESTRPGQLVVKPWTLGHEVSGSRSCRVAAHCGPEQVTFKQLLGLMTQRNTNIHQMQQRINDQTLPYRAKLCKQIRQTCLCNMQRFLMAVKMILLESKIFFLIFALNIDCGFTLELPQ